jgi:glycosyltransferase involved in cell wall biosynthesis
LVNRILFVVDNLDSLGPAAVCWETIREASAGCAEVHLAILEGQVDAGWVSPDGKVYRCISLQEPSASRRAAEEQKFSLDHLWRLSRRLRALIAELAPQTVYAWSLRAALVTAQLNLSGGGLIRPRPRFCYRESFSWPRLSSRCGYLLRRGSRIFDQVLVTHPSIGQFLGSYGYRERISLTPVRWQRDVEFEENGPQGLEQTRLELRQSLNLPAKSIVVASVAPLIAATRLKDLVWAAGLLTVVYDDFHLVLCGEGPQRSRLERFAEITGAGENVHVLHPADFPQRMLAAIDCYWHSHLLEPLSANLLQAMQLERPVIAVYGAGTGEIIRHQQTGLGTRLGGRDEFARWTKYLIEQPAARQQLVEQGRQFIESHFVGPTGS